MGIYWLASYPKSGNTWCRAFLYNYLHSGEQPADINELRLGRMPSLRNWIDEVLGFDSSELSEDEVELLRPDVYRWENTSGEISYRKTHDAYTYLPDGEPLFPVEGMLGAIYIIRNPLDVAVSYSHYNHCSIDRAIEQMGKNLYLSLSSNKRLDMHVRQHLLTWSQHVASWVDAPGIRAETLRYEDMQSAPINAFTRLVRFLGLPDDEERIARAVRFSEFNTLKAQEISNGFKDSPTGVQDFFRKGIVGDWENVLTETQVHRIIADHGEIMARFGYLDALGNPMEVS
ncbi:MAG TPA: sulfotransferase domain-containing protein [Gallionella sp.]|nr:sulfotransferase domain-containing protein [Gallionella sp.]